MWHLATVLMVITFVRLKCAQEYDGELFAITVEVCAGI